MTRQVSPAAVAERWQEEVRAAALSRHQLAVFEIVIAGLVRVSRRLDAFEKVLARKGLQTEERVALADAKATKVEGRDPETWREFPSLVAVLLSAAE